MLALLAGQGALGAAPRARQRYAVCNDGDTQGTLPIPRDGSASDFTGACMPGLGSQNKQDDGGKKTKTKTNNGGQAVFCVL